MNEVIDPNSYFNQLLDKYAQIISAIDVCSDKFKKSVVGMKQFVNDSYIPKIKNYKKWNLDDILLWIRCLENGRFIPYLAKLKNGFVKSEIVTGGELPHLSTADLSCPPFGIIKTFRDKRNLIEHFQKLKDGNKQKRSGCELIGFDPDRFKFVEKQSESVDEKYID